MYKYIVPLAVLVLALSKMGVIEGLTDAPAAATATAPATAATATSVAASTYKLPIELKPRQIHESSGNVPDMTQYVLKSSIPPCPANQDASNLLSKAPSDNSTASPSSTAVPSRTAAPSITAAPSSTTVPAEADWGKTMSKHMDTVTELLKEYVMYIVIGIIAIFGIYVFSNKEGGSPMRTSVGYSNSADNVDKFLATA
jgi:hypothetical protein